MLACITPINFPREFPRPPPAPTLPPALAPPAPAISSSPASLFVPRRADPDETISFPSRPEPVRRASSVAASPPTMKTSSPFSAPHVPPVTGASSDSTPRSAHAAAIRRSSAGETVLESISTLPRRIAFQRAFAPQHRFQRRRIARIAAPPAMAPTFSPRFTSTSATARTATWIAPPISRLRRAGPIRTASRSLDGAPRAL